jgi:hypothetical protein
MSKGGREKMAFVCLNAATGTLNEDVLLSLVTNFPQKHCCITLNIII